MVDKITAKNEVGDERLKQEIDELIKNRDYEICPYVVRIYDFINIARTGNGSDRNLGVQCLYKGSVHNAKNLCLKNFAECPKYRELRRHDEIMENNRGQKG